MGKIGSNPLHGYISLHIKDCKVLNAFVHLTDLPKDGEFVLHVPGESVLIKTLQEFREAHPQNGDETKISPYKAVFDLGDQTIHTLLIMDHET
jgi:hypothetical protein